MTDYRLDAVTIAEQAAYLLCGLLDSVPRKHRELEDQARRAAVRVLLSFEEGCGRTGDGRVTGLTLAIGTSTWIFSALKFQADMGVLLTFMFFGNMLGALLVLPSLAVFILRKKPPQNA